MRASNIRDFATDLKHDIERWSKDLAMWERAGHANSRPANVIRTWIAEAVSLIAGIRR